MYDKSYEGVRIKLHEIRISQEVIRYCKDKCKILEQDIEKLEIEIEKITDEKLLEESRARIWLMKLDYSYYDGRRTSEYLNIQKLKQQ